MVRYRTTVKDELRTKDDLSATFVQKGRDSIAVYQDFSGMADGPLNGVTPSVGPAFLTTGANPTTVTSGYAVSTGTGYLYSSLSGTPTVIWAETAFTGDPTVGIMTMALSKDADHSITNVVHVNYGADGFGVSVRADGGTFDSIPGSGARWIRQIPVDGTTAPRIAVVLHGSTLTIVGPNGEVRSVNDPRIAQLSGGMIFWEPNQAGSNKAFLKRCGATTTALTGAVTPLLGPGDLSGSFNIDAGDRVVGGRGSAFEVAIGKRSITGLPGIEFGPSSSTKYGAALTSAATVGATSIVTDKYIPSGSTIILESGTNNETVTASANSTGTGPFTTTVGATTKTHAAGVAAVVTVPASYGAAVELHFGSLRFDNNVIFNKSGGSIYLDGQTVYLTQAAAGVLAVGGTGAGKGCLMTGKAATGSRPAAATVGQGAQFFDTTLGKPIWSDGTNWKDAAGNTV